MEIKNDWHLFLEDELATDSFFELNKFLENEYKKKTIFPKYEDIFRAFNLLQLNKIKVVIIGQDPYHGEKQANGLAFSVSEQSKIPPSLKNIFKELIDDIDCSMPLNGNLEKWSKQGVLLINTVLTVEESKANSHKTKGWEIFTDSVIKKLSLQMTHLVFILWGASAQKKELLVDETKHLVLKAPHPSPLSSYRGFFGSKPFSQSNTYLKKYNKKEIDWCLNSH